MPERGEKSIGQLFSELTSELRTLFRQELELFTTEMKEKSKVLAKDAAAIGVGAFVVYCGVLVLLAAMVLGLATVMPAWGAALVVAAVFLVAGFVLIQYGRKDLSHMEMKPEQTADTVKETVQWAKTLKHTSSTPRRTGFASRSGIRKAI